MQDVGDKKRGKLRVCQKLGEGAEKINVCNVRYIFFTESSDSYTFYIIAILI